MWGFFKLFASNMNWKELCKENLGQKKTKKTTTTNHLRDVIVSFSRGYDNQGKVRRILFVLILP